MLIIFNSVDLGLGYYYTQKSGPIILGLKGHFRLPRILSKPHESHIMTPYPIILSQPLQAMSPDWSHDPA